MGGALQRTRNVMDLFSAFSGFLIYGVLLNSNGCINYFRNFHERRALGIWPFACLILEILLIGLAFIPEGGWKMVRRKYLKSKSEISTRATWHKVSIRFSRETP